jgi:hypothetical protein
MFNIAAELSNPFRKMSNRFDYISLSNGILSNHLAWELEWVKNTIILGFSLSLTTKQDHAGLTCNIGLFGNTLHLTIYDIRHWNYDTNSWGES